MAIRDRFSVTGRLTTEFRELSVKVSVSLGLHLELAIFQWIVCKSR